MKTKAFVLSFVLMLMFGICVKAQEPQYNITVPNGFTVAQKDNNIETAAELLNIDSTALSERFTKNGLIYLAISNDAKTQVRLSSFNDNFSSAVGDISYLDNDALNEFVIAVGGKNQESIIENNNRKFVVVKNTLNDSGGVYTVTQYVTIANNKTYYLSCYNDGNETSAEINTIFKSFNFSENQLKTTEEETKSTISRGIVFYSIGIAVFLTVAIIMIIGILRNSNFLKNKTEYKTK